MECAACGEPNPIPICRSCGAELVSDALSPTAERAATDGDQTASDQDQTSSDDDQSASDQDQTSADHDQTTSDSDQRSSDKDQEAADDDLAAGGDPATHARTTEERADATGDRADTSEGRDDTGDSREQTADDRDRAGAARDRGGQHRDSVASLHVGPDGAKPSRDDLAMRAEADRVRAAADRAAAAAERARAAADRSLAARERAEAIQVRTDATHALELAATDQLTGARIRRTGLDDLTREIARVQRTRGGLTLAFVDVDGLKQVNDTDGYSAGDALLRLIGETLHTHLRPHDLIVRYGGDEFVCAMPSLSLTETTARFELVAAFLRRDHETHSITFGLSELDPVDTLEELVARAEDDLLERRRARSSGT
jgi:diguanylate cyclase (GGDEF)-like protein